MKLLRLAPILPAAILLVSPYCRTSAAARAQLPPLPGTGTLAPAPDPDHFQFVAGGDNRPAHPDEPLPAVPRKIFDRVRGSGAAFAIWSGDTIYGKSERSEGRRHIGKRYREFLELAKRGGVPVFNAPGNHEIDNHKELSRWYEEFMGPLEGSFDYGNSHFIAVNTEELVAAKKVAAGEEFGGSVSDAQVRRIRADLDANRGKAHVFLFMHRPIIPDPIHAGHALDKTSAATLRELFSHYPNIDYVIAGHQHLYYRAPQPEHPVYVVSGGAGAPLFRSKDGSLPPDSFNHYLHFHVDGPKVTYTVERVD